MIPTPIALTIAGSDSGSGAGVQADLRTFTALGVYAATAITAVTSQNTVEVVDVFPLPAEVVAAQIAAVRADFYVAAIKTGMLATAKICEAVVTSLRKGPAALVVSDPVLSASVGASFGNEALIAAMRTRLLPEVDCLTPNLGEAALLLGRPIARTEDEMAAQARALLDLGAKAVLIKGGHLQGDEAVDWLVWRDGRRRYAAPKMNTSNLHGTGCTLASAVVAGLVKGLALPDAVMTAKEFTLGAIRRAVGGQLGSGSGPLLQFSIADELRPR